MSGPKGPSALPPMKFAPIFQYRLWGGRSLGGWMDQILPGEGPIGEAWVLSDRADQASRVIGGPMQGRTLPDLMSAQKTAILGRWSSRFDRFPLLLKFLDVEKMLSVQVHPRDDQTDLIPPGDTGKTEAWVVLQARPGARIYAGLKPHTTARDLRALNARSADDHLASFQPAAGQGVLIKAGTVHSLGDGAMVFEVQENSDVTFRLYDWDHLDARTGKPRDLQIEQALACIDLRQGPTLPVDPRVVDEGGLRRETLFDNPHFRLQRLSAGQPFLVGAQDEPRVLVCVDGEGEVEGGDAVTLERGAVVLLPACVGQRPFRPNQAVTLLEVAIGHTQ